MDNQSIFNIDSEYENEILTLKPGEIQVKTVEWSIFSIMKYIDSGRILINPDFQRSYVRTDQQAMNLIDSLYKRLPIPAIFVVEDENGKNIVIDGQQRLISLCRFYFEDDKIKEILKELDSGITKLKVPGKVFGKDINNLHYSDKEFEDLRFKFDNLNILFTQISIVNIDKDRQDSIIRLIFSRLNTGGTKAMLQELREAKYPCKSMTLIQSLSYNQKRKKLFNFTSPPSKFTESFLRAFAYYYSVKNGIFNSLYNGNLSIFLNDFAKYMQSHDEDINACIEDALSKIKIEHNSLNSSLFIHSTGRFNAQYVDIFISGLCSLEDKDINVLINNFMNFKGKKELVSEYIVDQRTTQKILIEKKVNFGISLTGL